MDGWIYECVDGWVVGWMCMWVDGYVVDEWWVNEWVGE